jgi:AAA domain
VQAEDMDAREGGQERYEQWPEDDAPDERVDWAQPNFAARGELTAIWSDGGVGTTTLLIAASALWTRGLGIFGLAAPERPLQVLASCPETDFKTMIAPAFRRQGGDKTLCTFVKAEDAPHLLDNGCARLRKLIEDIGPDVVWLDPLMSHASGVKWNDPGAARKKMDELVRVAREFDIALIFRDHFNKASGVADITYRASGSAQKVNAPRAHFIAVQMPQDEAETKYQAVLSLDKHNLRMSFPHVLYRTVELGRDTDAIGFEYLGTSEKSAAEINDAQAKKQYAVSPTKAIRAVLDAYPNAVHSYDQVMTLYSNLNAKQVSTAVSRLSKNGELVTLANSSFRAYTPAERAGIKAMNLRASTASAERLLRDGIEFEALAAEGDRIWNEAVKTYGPTPLAGIVAQEEIQRAGVEWCKRGGKAAPVTFESAEGE